MVMESKICGKCKLSLPTNQFSYFFEKHRNKWRYASYCRSCQKQNARKHYEANREKCIAMNRIWQNNNKERHSQIVFKYQKKERDTINNTYVWKLLNASNISKEFANQNPEIIEARRLQLKLKRKLKQLKNGTQQIK